MLYIAYGDDVNKYLSEYEHQAQVISLFRDALFINYEGWHQCMHQAKSRINRHQNQ